MTGERPIEPARVRFLLQLALGAALFAVVILGLIIFMQYRALEREQYVPRALSPLSALKQRGTLTPADSALIQNWMTFDYIDHIFSLPPSYLQTALNIKDPRYPKVAIEEYAEDAHLGETATLQAVRDAVSAYQPAQ